MKKLLYITLLIVILIFFYKYEYYYLFKILNNIVECSEKFPIDLSLPVKEIISSTEELTKTTNINNSSQSDYTNNTLNTHLESNNLTLAREALNTIKKVLESYVPIVTVIIVAAGTAIILKTLPPKYRTKAMIKAGLLTGGVTVILQIINTTTKEEINLNSSSNLDKSLNKSPELNTNTFINSPSEGLEGLTNLDMLVVGIIIVDLGVLLGIFLILINFTIKLFKLESREFVTSRPKLHKFVILSLKSRDYTTFFIIIMVLFGACSIFYGLSYLLHFIKILKI